MLIDTPMCKVKQARCPRVLLESKPVFYSWFPAQVGPQVGNPRFRMEVHAHSLATVATYHLTRKNASYGLDSEMGGMESPQVATTTTYTMFG